MSNFPIYGWTDAYVAWTEVQRASVRALADRFRADSNTVWEEVEMAISSKELEMGHAMSFVGAQVEASHGASNCDFFAGAKVLDHFARRYAAKTAECMFKQSGVSGCRTYRAIFTGRMSELMFPSPDIANPDEVQKYLEPVFAAAGHVHEERDGFEDFLDTGPSTDADSGHECQLNLAYGALVSKFAADIHVVDVTGDDDPTPWESVYVLLAADNFKVNAMFSVSAHGSDAFLPEEKSQKCDHLRLLEAVEVHSTNAFQLLRRRAFLSKTENRLIHISEETGDYKRLAYLRVGKKFSAHFNETNHYEVYNMFGQYSFDHLQRREHLLLASSLDLPVPFVVYSQPGPATTAYLTAAALCGTDSKSRMARMVMLSWADAHVPGKIPIPKMSTVSTALQNGWAIYLRDQLSTATHSSADTNSVETAAKFVSTMGQFGKFIEDVVGYESHTVKFPSVYGMFPLSYVAIKDAVSFSAQMQIMCNSIRERVFGQINPDSLSSDDLETAILRVKELIQTAKSLRKFEDSEDPFSVVTPITHPISSEEELADAIQKTIEKYSSSLGDNSIIAILDEDGKVIGAQNVITGEEVRDPRVIQTLQKIATAAVVEIKSMPEDEKSAVRIDGIHSPEVSIKAVRPTAVDDKSIAVPYSGEIKLTPMSQKQRQKFSSLRN
jgi:hypothetical protein